MFGIFENIVQLSACLGKATLCVIGYSMNTCCVSPSPSCSEWGTSAKEAESTPLWIIQTKAHGFSPQIHQQIHFGIDRNHPKHKYTKLTIYYASSQVYVLWKTTCILQGTLNVLKFICDIFKDQSQHNLFRFT